MDASELHQAVRPLAGLLGRWRGQGEGDYPTIAGPFRYLEELEFASVGKPFLSYAQRTRSPETGLPLHAEVGYLRASSPVGASVPVELVLAHPTGIAEIEEGSLDDGVLVLRSTTVARSSTAKEVVALRRRFELAGDTLSYELWMAHGETPETSHLRAELHRVG